MPTVPHYQFDVTDHRVKLVLEGDWTVHTIAGVQRSLAHLEAGDVKALDVDLTGVGVGSAHTLTPLGRKNYVYKVDGTIVGRLSAVALNTLDAIAVSLMATVKDQEACGNASAASNRARQKVVQAGEQLGALQGELNAAQVSSAQRSSAQPSPAHLLSISLTA